MQYEIGSKVRVLTNLYNQLGVKIGDVLIITQRCENLWLVESDTLLLYFRENEIEPVSEETESPVESIQIEKLTLDIPSGTKRLEGEFEGYKVILEKIN